MRNCKGVINLQKSMKSKQDEEDVLMEEGHSSQGRMKRLSMLGVGQKYEVAT